RLIEWMRIADRTSMPIRDRIERNTQTIRLCKNLPDFTNESGSSHRHKKIADLCIFSEFNNWIINKYCLE
ncbi:hypothetical protein OSK35_25220, partial [Escherichia coli]|nr:hypothetical protein [Escherichia coli]